MKKKRCIFAAAATLCLLYGAALTVIGVSVKPVASDAAVILGNEVLKDGTPSKALTSRLEAGMTVYNEHLADILVVSGGVGHTAYNEADVMEKYLREHGIPQDRIIVDRIGVNTRATAVNTAKLMQQNHWNSVIIVSQFYHLPRCILAFHQAGIANFSAAYPHTYFVKDIIALLREEVGLVAYFIGLK